MEEDDKEEEEVDEKEEVEEVNEKEVLKIYQVHGASHSYLLSRITFNEKLLKVQF